MQAELAEALEAQVRPSPRTAERHPRIAFEETSIARAVLDSTGEFVAVNRMMSHYTSGTGHVLLERCGGQGNLQLSALPASSVNA